MVVMPGASRWVVHRVRFAKKAVVGKGHVQTLAKMARRVVRAIRCRRVARKRAAVLIGVLSLPVLQGRVVRKDFAQ
jgi:hypothetical protein